MPRFTALFVFTGMLLMSASASALLPKTFKHDQFSEDIVSAAAQIGALPLAVHSGYIEGEAFGQIYKPAPGDYPVKLMGVDLFLAAPPNLPDGEDSAAHATIEVWFHDGSGANPGKSEPDYSVSTHDLFNIDIGQPGKPLQGGMAYQIDFDWEDVLGHPPLLMEGYFRIVVRFEDPGESLGDWWNTAWCDKTVALGMCGCQKVGTIHDQATTSQSNVLNIVGVMPGTCEGATSWTFSETLGVTGDIIMRARAEVQDNGGCTPNCEGKECGSDGCGEQCGACGAGKICVQGECVDNGGCDIQCADKECGDDGCGGLCGVCGQGDVCVQGTCQNESTCQPVCAGKECGDDGCAGDCGSCPAVAPVCYEFSCCVPLCDGIECGADGCGGSCGSCPGAAPLCEEGICTADCVPQCDGMECGDDGCGDVCGSCPAAAPACLEGVCVVEQDEPEVTITAISPDSGFNDVATDVTITGTGFAAGATAKLGATDLENVSVTGHSIVTATVPAGIAPDTYLLVVVNPDGSSGALADAFEVQQGGMGSTSGSCSVAAIPALPSILLLLMTMLGLAGMRDRR
jgi:hypothetical protein